MSTNSKFLPESARITNAYFNMYAQKVNEAATNDVKTVTKDVSKKQSAAKTPTVQKKPEPPKKEAEGINPVTGIPYPENGDVEFNGPEEDYLHGEAKKSPKTLAPGAKEQYRKTVESCGKMHESRRERPYEKGVPVFTIEINRVLDDGEEEVVDDMKYAKTYYSAQKALADAKKAHSEYASDGGKYVVYVMGGEEERESGDIFGEPVTMFKVDGSEKDEVGNIDANESYENDDETDAEGDVESRYAEDYADDDLKSALAVLKKICSKHGAKVTGEPFDDGRGMVGVFIRISDRNKVPGTGFDMNYIMGVGRSIENEMKKAGIHGFVGAGGYTGNSTKVFIDAKRPIGESTEENAASGDGLVHVFDRGEDFPYVERYVALAPDGFPFFITRTGGVGTFGDGTYEYTTRAEMEGEFEGKELDYVPAEVLKGLRLIASNYYENEEPEIALEIRKYVSAQRGSGVGESTEEEDSEKNDSSNAADMKKEWEEMVKVGRKTTGMPPCFEFDDGDVVYLQYDEKDNAVLWGGATNSGFFETGRLSCNDYTNLYDVMEDIYNRIADEKASKSED